MAHRHRLEVPGDLSVCGFDDSAMSTTIWPEITTIRQPVAQMAKAATALLVDAVRSRAALRENAVQHIRLAFELVRRASDGPPNRS